MYFRTIQDYVISPQNAMNLNKMILQIIGDQTTWVSKSLLVSKVVQSFHRINNAKCQWAWAYILYKNITVRGKCSWDIFYYIDRNKFPVIGIKFRFYKDSSCQRCFLSNCWRWIMILPTLFIFWSKFKHLDREYSENYAKGQPNLLGNRMSGLSFVIL